MKGRRIVGILLMVITLTACSSRMTFEEAIESEIPFNVKRVIYTEKVKDGEIVLYITEQERERELIEAMAVAFMKKDEKSGWENAGNNHYDYQENPNLTVYMNTFYDYDRQGNLENKIPIIYGKINNPSIKMVQVAGENSPFEDAKIIFSGGSHYFIKLGEYVKAKGTDGSGEVVEEYEKKK